MQNGSASMLLLALTVLASPLLKASENLPASYGAQAPVTARATTLLLLSAYRGHPKLQQSTSLALRDGESTSLALRDGESTSLALRGGGAMSDDDEEDDDSEVDSELTRDKYADEPPPNHIRYSGGMPPPPNDVVELVRNSTLDLNATLAAEDAACASIEKEDQNDGAMEAIMKADMNKDSTDDDDEPLWIPGQVRQGGKKLKWVDGHADYWRDVLNTTDPTLRFEPNHSIGQTYSDMDFAKKSWESYSITEQDGIRTDILDELRADGITVRAMPTHNFSMGPLPNYYEREYGNDSYNGTWHEHKFFEKDYVANTINHTFSLMIPEPVLLQQLHTKKTHVLQNHERQVPFVAPKSMPDAPQHETLEHLLDALDDMDRWKAGELPMELNAEDLAEIEADKRRQTDEQLIEAARKGSMGMVRSLIELGANISAVDEDELQPLHHAALNGNKDIVELLLAKGVNVNVTDNYNRTALHWAAYNGHTDVAQVLYDAGVHVCAKTPGGSTAYAFAAMYMHGENDKINFFRTEEAKYNKELQGRSQFVSSLVGSNSTRAAAEKNRLLHPLAAAYD